MIMAIAIVSHSVLYDGMRHVLFAVPPLAVVCGIGVAKLIHGRIRTGFNITSCVFIFFSLGLTVYGMIDLHPYQTIYFSRLFGGGLKNDSSESMSQIIGVAAIKKDVSGF